jgi:hypothetical protein
VRVKRLDLFARALTLLEQPGHALELDLQLIVRVPLAVQRLRHAAQLAQLAERAGQLLLIPRRLGLRGPRFHLRGLHPARHPLDLRLHGVFVRHQLLELEL